MPNTYEMPWLGQPFKLTQNETIVEYASVGGVRVTGEYLDDNGVTQKSWTAVISSPISHAFRFYHNTEVGDWKPLSGEEMAALRGATVLGDMVDKATFLQVTARLAVLEEERLAEQDAHAVLLKRLAALENPAPIVPPPPAPVNGAARPSRVAQ
jgi:hypothetical protein